MLTAVAEFRPVAGFFLSIFCLILGQNLDAAKIQNHNVILFRFLILLKAVKFEIYLYDLIFYLQ